MGCRKLTWKGQRSSNAWGQRVLQAGSGTREDPDKETFHVRVEEDGRAGGESGGEGAGLRCPRAQGACTLPPRRAEHLQMPAAVLGEAIATVGRAGRQVGDSLSLKHTCLLASHQRLHAASPTVSASHPFPGSSSSAHLLDAGVPQRLGLGSRFFLLYLCRAPPHPEVSHRKRNQCR